MAEDNNFKLLRRNTLGPFTPPVPPVGYDAQSILRSLIRGPGSIVTPFNMGSARPSIPSPNQLRIMESKLPPGMQDRNNPNVNIMERPTPLENLFDQGKLTPSNDIPNINKLPSDVSLNRLKYLHSLYLQQGKLEEANFIKNLIDSMK